MGLYNRPGSANYYWRVQHNGRTYSGSTGTRVRRDAEKVLNLKRAEIIEAAPARSDGQRGDLAEIGGLELAETQARGVSRGTLRGSRYAWQALAKFFGGASDPRRIDTDAIIAYVAHRRPDAKATTIRRELQALRRGLRIAKRRGWILRVPDEWPTVSSKRDGHRPKRQANKSHDPDVLRRWFGELRGEAYAQARIAILTGLRSGELSQLRQSWVSGSMLTVPSWAAKSRAERTIALVPEVIELISEHADGDEPVFGAAEHKTARLNACKRIGYDRTITLRDLRSYYLTHSARGTGDVVAAQQAAGHSDLRVTQRYLHADQARLQAASDAVAASLGGDCDRSAVTGGGWNRLSAGNCWSQESDSNRRPADYESISAMLAHVSACFYCQEKVAECLKMHPEAVACCDR